MCAADTAVADVALNILCLLMKDHWSWLCTENIQKTIRLLFGTFIERYELSFHTRPPSNSKHMSIYNYKHLRSLLLMSRIFCFRWLDVGVAHLTSAPCWVIYLQVLQEAVWPGGTLPVQPRTERGAAQRSETKKQCLACLVQLLPGSSSRPFEFCLFHCFFFSPFCPSLAWTESVTDILGSEKFRLSIETVLESLQDPQINKWVGWWKIKLHQWQITADYR